MNRINKMEVLVFALVQTISTYFYAGITSAPIVFWYMTNGLKTNELMVLCSFLLGAIYGIFVSVNEIKLNQ